MTIRSGDYLFVALSCMLQKIHFGVYFASAILCKHIFTKEQYNKVTFFFGGGLWESKIWSMTNVFVDNFFIFEPAVLGEVMKNMLTRMCPAEIISYKNIFIACFVERCGTTLSSSLCRNSKIY